MKTVMQTIRNVGFLETLMLNMFNLFHERSMTVFDRFMTISERFKTDFIFKRVLRRLETVKNVHENVHANGQEH
jgi:hypothetical protein